MQPFSIRSLDDDTAFITGASAGIGRATAFKLAALGARVVLGARRSDRLQQVKAEIEAAIPEAKVAAVVVDVTDRKAIASWFKQGEAALGPCSILVDNAGLALGRAHVADTSAADQDTVLDVNVRAAFDLVRLVLPGMKARGRGDLVLMASVAGSEPYAGGAVYCASKAALQAFARSLRAELLGTDIRVLTLDPGLVETEFAMVRFGGDVAAAKKPYEGLTPLTADDVADCAAFALSRPRHMSLDRMLILAQAQLGTQQFARRP
jgi:NADP-dependent 3-hydroxy acid dehydrogenase YdfG